MNAPLLLIGGLSTFEAIFAAMIGLLLFGSKLPDVGRSLGRSLLEFKKGMTGLQEGLQNSDSEASRLLDEEQRRTREREAREARDREAREHDANYGDQGYHTPSPPPADNGPPPPTSAGH